MPLEVLKSPEDTAEQTAWGAAPPPDIAEQEFDAVAFELWQRGSCPAVEDEVWVDAEENVLAPH